MTVFEIIGVVGALATIGIGLLGFLTPNAASRFTGLTATSKTAFAEFRGTFGGLFLAMGLFPLITASPDAYLMAALLWFASAAGRVVSIVVDQGHREPRNAGGVLVESLIGLLMLGGAG